MCSVYSVNEVKSVACANEFSVRLNTLVYEGGAPALQLNHNSLFIHCSVYKESIVDVEGLVSAAPEKITSCSQQDVEIVITKVTHGKDGVQN